MNKYIAQLPNGLTATRNSKTRTYTHMVAGRRSAESKRKSYRKSIEMFLEHAAEYEQKLEKLRAGEWRWTFRSGKTINDTVEQDIAEYEKFLADSLKKADEYQARLDADDFEDSWHDLGWCGRPDLADKKAASEARRYAEVIIIEAEAA